MVSVLYRPAAEFELQEAYNWYEGREPGLGSEFMRCIDSCLQLIHRHPEVATGTKIEYEALPRS
jgi:hypothetical protein